MSVPSASSSYFPMAAPSASTSSSATSTPTSSPPSESSPIAQQHQRTSPDSTLQLSPSLSSCSSSASSSSSEAGSSSSTPKRIKPKKRVSFAPDTADNDQKEWVPSGIPGVGPTRQSSLKWRDFTGSAVFQLNLSQEELSRTVDTSWKYSEGIVASP